MLLALERLREGSDKVLVVTHDSDIKRAAAECHRVIKLRAPATSPGPQP